MDIRIKTTNYQITQEVSDHLDERVASIEKMLGSDAGAARCEVELGRAGGDQRHGEHSWFAEFVIHVPGSERIVARNSEPTVNAAIDNAKEELLVQLRKFKGKNTHVLRRTGAAIKRFIRFGAED